MDILKKVGLNFSLVLMVTLLTLIMVYRKKYFDIITNPSSHCFKDWKCWTSDIKDNQTYDIKTDWEKTLKQMTTPPKAITESLTDGTCDFNKLKNFKPENVDSQTKTGKAQKSTLCPGN